MSEEQINRIMKKLAEQDKMLEDIMTQLDELQPVKEAFDNVMGFDRVAMWILKALAALGVAIGFIYAFFEWIRK